MFKKIKDIYDEGMFYKYYNCDCSIYEAMDTVLNSNIEIKTVEVSDVGDNSMRYFGGKYSYDDFMNIYDRVRSDIDTLSLTLMDNKGYIGFSTGIDSIRLVVKDKNLELNDLLEKKTYKF